MHAVGGGRSKNGNIPNIWTLDLTNGQLKQWTDTATGNVSPVVLHQTAALKVAFISYYKGEYGIHVVTGDKPIATVDVERLRIARPGDRFLGRRSATR